MKGVLIVTNLLFLGIILFMGCNQDPSNSTDTNVPALLNCSLKCKEYPGLDPAGAVSSRVIKQLSNAYFEDMNKSRIRGTQQGDALSLTFELDEIKNLIWHIDSAVCNSGCNKVPVGIKFYYIKYDKNNMQGLTPDMQAVINANPNKHSLVMVPAYLSGDKWYDFNYKQLTSNCGFTSTVDSIIGVMNLRGNNHGGIGPPPEPGTFPTIEN